MLHVSFQGRSVHHLLVLPKTLDHKAQFNAQADENVNLIHLVGSHVRFLARISFDQLDVKWL